jgi:hypothetical protein
MDKILMVSLYIFEIPSISQELTNQLNHFKKSTHRNSSRRKYMVKEFFWDNQILTIIYIQVYVPQNAAKIYMFHIFCLMYIIWFLDIF